MNRFAIQYTPTGDLLDSEGFLSSPEWPGKELMLFDDQGDAEDYLHNQLYYPDEQDFTHEVIQYHL